MKEKDMIYSCVIVILFVLIGILFWNNISLNNDFKIFSLKNSLQNDLTNLELESLFVGEASESGLYVSPRALLIGKAPGEINLILNNKFKSLSNFSIEVYPNKSINPYISYENISLNGNNAAVSIPPGETVKARILVSTSMYEFDRPTIEQPLPQYIINVTIGNETYAAGTFTVFAIPQKDIDDL